MIKKIIKILKEDFTLIVGNYFQQFASIIFGVLIAKQLNPEAFGIFGLAILVNNYLKFLNLGGQYSINKRLSLRTDSWTAYNYLNLNVIIYPIIIGIIMIVMLLFNLIPTLNSYYVYIWFFLCLDNAFQLIQGVIRAKGQSELLGKSKIVTGAIIIILVPIFWYFNSENDPFPLFVKLLIVPFIGLIFLFSSKEVRNFIFIPKLKLSKNVKHYISEGVLLCIYVFAQDFLSSIDRFFIATYYSKYDLGLYSFAFSLASPILLVLTTIMYMDYSRHMSLFKDSTKTNFIELKNKMLKKFFSIYIILAILGSVFVYFLLQYYLVQYISSYFVVLVILLVYIPDIMCFPYTVYYVANGENKLIIKIVIVGLILSVILNLSVVYLNANYIYIAGITIIAKFVMYALFKQKFKNLFYDSTTLQNNQ